MISNLVSGTSCLSVKLSPVPGTDLQKPGVSGRWLKQTHTGQGTDGQCGAESQKCDSYITPPSKAQGPSWKEGVQRLYEPEVRRTEGNSVFYTWRDSSTHELKAIVVV